MAAKKKDPQNYGVNVENSSVRIGGDLVGRDKVERHEYYGDNPYRDFEDFHAGSPLAKLLTVFGGIMLGGGFLGFVASVIYAFLNFPTRMDSIIPYVGVCFGIGVVGMVILAIGRGMARNRAYRQRQRNR
jgi:hypothetical protein